MLSTPPAFILSQDQTLEKNLIQVSEISADISYPDPYWFKGQFLKIKLLRIFKVVSLFSYQRTLMSAHLSGDSINLSLTKSFVNRFFWESEKIFYLPIQRRRRDLNPRAAINDLLPFQGSPFNHLGTSAYVPMPECKSCSVLLVLSQTCFAILLNDPFFVKRFMSIFAIIF